MLNRVEYAGDLTFDENDVLLSARLATKIRPLKLDIGTVTRDPDDFKYLIGMCYRDDDNLMYLTTRIEVERSFIVLYRCPVINNERGAEEHQPIHVAEVEKLLKVFVSSEKLLVDIGVHKTQLQEVGDGGEEESENLAGPAVAGATSEVMDNSNSGSKSTTVGTGPVGVPRSESR